MKGEEEVVEEMVVEGMKGEEVVEEEMVVVGMEEEVVVCKEEEVAEVDRGVCKLAIAAQQQSTCTCVEINQLTTISR